MRNGNPRLLKGLEARSGLIRAIALDAEGQTQGFRLKEQVRNRTGRPHRTFGRSLISISPGHNSDHGIILEESAQVVRPNGHASTGKEKNRSCDSILRLSRWRLFGGGFEMSTIQVMSLLLALWGWSAQVMENESNEFVVHEWGTFTSISGVESQTLEWTSYRNGAELPGFVYGSKVNARGTVRMETPVIYFYSPKELTCTVKVSFPQGEITEYYPMPDFPVFRARGIEWKHVELLPGRAVNLPLESSGNHYYHARATESVPLRVWKGNVIDEYEKFLFYRGVGSFAMPLSVQIHEDKVVAQQGVTSALQEVIFFENRQGRTSCLRSGLLSPSVVVNRPFPDCSVESLKSELEILLATHGLYPKEAEAMVRTWDDSWFEEGFRVFYVLPRQQTDTILPLEITPKPTKLVRVLVGRMEIMTLEVGQEILQILTRLMRSPGIQNGEVLKVQRRFGRFLAPMVREVLDKHPALLWDPALESSLTSLGVPVRGGSVARVSR